ncbi:MAG: hypothetical protein U5R31_05185 [Acidimicrobiia bacterium]|nr:hypothetical protein [Acidimicrobiia bacterium]
MSAPTESGVVTAIALTDLGLRLLAQRHRREHPEASEDEVEAAVRVWLLERPGAPDGDAVGRPVSLPHER